jgi:DNA topoisomerase-1
MDKVTTLGVADPQYVCPKCKSSMIIKLGRSGKFISCGKYPECDGALTIEGKEIEPNRPIGTHPESGEEIFILEGPYGPYVQVGEKTKENKKPKRASIPKDKELSEVTIDDALKYLSLPKTLGQHPETEKNIVANIGRFGPYVMHDGDFRSLKTDDVYTIELARALEIIAEPKKTRTRKSAATKKASSTRTKKKK